MRSATPTTAMRTFLCFAWWAAGDAASLALTDAGFPPDPDAGRQFDCAIVDVARVETGACGQVNRVMTVFAEAQIRRHLR